MKDIAIIIGMIVIAMGVGSWLLFYGTGNQLASPSSPTHADGSVSFAVVVQGDKATAITQRTNYRIQNADQLASLWSMVYGGNAPALPHVDFSTDEVLAVFDGTHSTSGYGVSVSNVVDAGGTRTVTIVHTIPDTTCVTMQNVTAPFSMIALPKTTNVITHEDTVATTTCK